MEKNIQRMSKRSCLIILIILVTLSSTFVYHSFDILTKEIKKLEKENKSLLETVDSIERKNSNLIEENKRLVERNGKLSREMEKTNWDSYVMTHYTSYCTGCIGITYSGYDVRETIYNPNGLRVVAVDPKLIPIGSILEIYDGENTFKAQALDTGSKIKGNVIDLLVNTKEEAFRLGRKDIKVNVLREGW